jgi:hypothetical protein
MPRDADPAREPRTTPRSQLPFHLRSAPLGVRALAAAVVMLTAAAGQAQPPPDAATRAKAHYELGVTAYGLGHYDRAVQAFTEAYQVDPAPILLYNIAQAHWKQGDRERAVTSYRRYLQADPGARNRAQIRSRIRALEADLKKNPSPPPAAPEPAPPAVAAEPPAPVPGPSSPSAGPWARPTPTPASEPAPTAPPASDPAGPWARPATAALPEPSPPPPPPVSDPAGPWARSETGATAEPQTGPTDPPAGEGARGRPELPRLDPVMPPPMTADLFSTAPPRDTPIYRRPWFWPALGAVGLVTVATIFLLRPDGPNWTCGAECVSTREVP